MYVTTFYSFKGGVGRTMALANVAAALASRKKRVLLVDFDLEAPGLDTFPILRPKTESLGVVDFVLTYIREDKAPKVEDFIWKSASFDNVYVMPSGSLGEKYASNFSQIDWTWLYGERDGYLLFEDLKEQWRQSIRPDYVLIDSRTGFTDTGGICTRQLPDAAVILFFPNEQNLRGLRKVVSDIRAEANSARQKQIELHFVMANVPDLDDEDDILTSMKNRFQSELNFANEPMVIHRYESLSLLNQAIFVKERPNSRLAREYGELATRIVGRNLADRDAAMRFLNRANSSFRRIRGRVQGTGLRFSEEIRKIEDLHRDDGEIVFLLGKFAAGQGTLEDAESLLDRSIDELDYREAEVYLERARTRDLLGDSGSAEEDSEAVLAQIEVPYPLVLQAMRHIRDDATQRATTSAAVLRLSGKEQLRLASDLSRINHMSRVAILNRIAHDTQYENELQTQARSELALDAMASKEFKRAHELLTYDDRDFEWMNLDDSFNAGMAVWALSGAVLENYFEQVVNIGDAVSESAREANYAQRIAMSYWALDDDENALRFANEAKTKGSQKLREYSYWRYELVPGRVFEKDVTDLAGYIERSERKLPSFFDAK